MRLKVVGGQWQRTNQMSPSSTAPSRTTVLTVLPVLLVFLQKLSPPHPLLEVRAMCHICRPESFPGLSNRVYIRVFVCNTQHMQLNILALDLVVCIQVLDQPRCFWSGAIIILTNRIGVTSTSTMTLEGCSLVTNTASFGSGGCIEMWSNSGTLILVDTILNNCQAYSGSGIEVRSASTLVVAGGTEFGT